MPGYGLIIGDKHLSSWSLRPWLLLRQFDLAFQEKVVRLDQPDTRQNILKFSPAARVPILLAGDLTIWDSLAIIEFIAERHPDLAVWPPRSSPSGPGPCHGGGNAFRVRGPARRPAV
ncbi:MAG: glutathione S-transferase N-terminal domain-containing protein [Alphaproteobacteria bacterium]|jgi:glutathione S-transferase